MAASKITSMSTFTAFVDPRCTPNLLVLDSGLEILPTGASFDDSWSIPFEDCC